MLCDQFEDILKKRNLSFPLLFHSFSPFWYESLEKWLIFSRKAEYKWYKTQRHKSKTACINIHVMVVSQFILILKENVVKMWCMSYQIINHIRIKDSWSRKWFTYWMTVCLLYSKRIHKRLRITSLFYLKFHFEIHKVFDSSANLVSIFSWMTSIEKFEQFRERKINWILMCVFKTFVKNRKSIPIVLVNHSLNLMMIVVVFLLFFKH